MRPYVRAANVSWRGLLLDDVKSMNFTDAEMDVYRLEKGDLLLNEASGSPGEVGKPALWQGEIEGCAFQNTLLRVRPREVESEYLLEYFRYQAITRRFADASRGVGIHHLGREALASWQVPLPPAIERRRIVEMLGRADAVRIKRRESLAEFDDLTQSIFLDMFGDPSGNPRGWDESLRLGEVAAVSSGITKGRNAGSAPVRAVPYLAVVNVQDRHLNLSDVKLIDVTEAEISRYRLMWNDLLLTEGGDPDKLGRGSLWREEISEAIHQNHIFRVRIIDPRIDPVYLSWLVSSIRGRRYFLRSAKQTTGIASINMSQIRQFPLLVPPLPMQREFARRIGIADQLKESYRASLAELDALFASLQDRAFRGEL